MTGMVVRTIVLALAWFAGINAIGSVLAVVLAGVIGDRAATNRPSVLLGVRLLPATLSIVFVGAMFLPAHWALEPRDAAETLGVALDIMAAVGAVLLLRSAWRVAAVARAGRLVDLGSHRCRGGVEHTYEVDTVTGVSLAGVVKPRILIGRTVKAALSSAELQVAIAHEVAHRDAFDNLARWCMLCAPDFLCGSAAAGCLEHAWHVVAESRADARAIQGDQARAVHLASALIKVARLSAVPSKAVAVPSWSTLNDSELLEWRVHRLLNGSPPQSDGDPRPGLIMLALALFLLIAAPVLAESVHRLTETLIALLP